MIDTPAPAPPVNPDAQGAMGQNAPPPVAPAPPLPVATADQAANAPAPQIASASIQPTQPAPPPGHFYHSLAHAFMSSALGVAKAVGDAVAPPAQPIGYTEDENGVMTKNPPRQLSGLERVGHLAGGALKTLGEFAAYGPFAPAVMMQEHNQKDLQMREQAHAEFNDKQKAMLNKNDIAHVVLGNFEIAKNLATSDLASNQHVADIGQDNVDSAVAGGNKTVGKLNMSDQEVAQYWRDNPDQRLLYTPFLTQATLATNEDGSAQIDPKTGIQKINRAWTLADMKSPIKLSDSMVKHAQQMGMPGAERLTEGQEMSPQQFHATVYSANEAYNAANRDSKNNEVIENSDGTRDMVNKVTKEVTPLIDPTTKQPLKGNVPTDQTTIFNPQTQKNEKWLINKNTGQHIMFEGEDKSDAASMTNTVGDYHQQGEAFLATVPPALQDVVKKVANYDLAPADLGRSNSRLQIIAAAAHYNPNLDEKLYKERFNYMSEYQSAKTGDGLSRASANTAIGHLGQLAQAGAALDANNLQAINNIAVKWGVATGNSAASVYDSIAFKAASEAAKAVKGGVPDEFEMGKLYEQLSSKLSAEQRRDVINAQFRLIQTPMDNMTKRFSENMGQSPESMGRPVLNNTSQAIMNKYLGTPTAPVTTQQVAPTASSPSQFQVTDPKGTVHTFKDQASVDGFKKLAGIK